MDYLLIIILVFIIMEAVAWFTHKYIMHGFLWSLHKDHHTPHKGFFEKNDWFFLIFAVPAFLFILSGTRHSDEISLAIGTGITLYGIAYFLIHEVLIHRRFQWFKNTSNTYLRAVKKAHQTHHKTLKKEHATCFGMLFVPLRFFLEAKDHHKSIR